MVLQTDPMLTRPASSPSFRLRNPSLNSLRLRRIFDVFDRNGDGIITVHELTRALEQLGLEADPAELECIVRSYMKPGSSGLEYEDFDSLHRELGDSLFGAECDSDGAEEGDLKEAFRVFDEDGDGFISAAELQSVLGKLGLKEGEEMESVRQMICSVDWNRDGRVDFHEFKQMMRSVSVSSS